MITRKLMEKSKQSAQGPTVNNNEKTGISLNESNPQNSTDNNCCSFSF